jgi:hypothetical protein
MQGKINVDKAPLYVGSWWGLCVKAMGLSTKRKMETKNMPMWIKMLWKCG